MTSRRRIPLTIGTVGSLAVAVAASFVPATLAAPEPLTRPAAVPVGPASAPVAPLTVSTDFPSGSGQVQEIDQQARRVRLVPTPHKGRGWACWWYAKVGGLAPGQTFTLDVGDGVWATPTQAAVSTDGGKTWRQTAPGKRSGQRIAYAVTTDAAEAWVAWGPPFTPADAEALVRRTAERADDPVVGRVRAFNLADSREGRPTPALEFLPPPPPPPPADGDRPAGDRPAADDRAAAGGRPKPFGVLVTARQHAWESGSSWVAKGFVDFLASDDPAARRLRRSAVVYVVPVMDVDNVAVGAGGKDQDPHDHNRDWTDAPVFPAVAACQRLVRDQVAAGSFDLFLDLHNPAAGDRRPFFFTGAPELRTDAGRAALARFVAAAKAEVTGPLAFAGDLRESGAAYDPAWRAMSGNWVTAHAAPAAVAVCLETSWNTPDSTAENYRTVGRQLGLAVERHLARREGDRKE